MDAIKNYNRNSNCSLSYPNFSMYFYFLQKIILVLHLTQNKSVEVTVMKKDNDSKGEPTLAEGINTEDMLNQDATPEEIENGESTNVTVLSLDENDPS